MDLEECQFSVDNSLLSDKIFQLNLRIILYEGYIPDQNISAINLLLSFMESYPSQQNEQNTATIKWD